MAKLILAFALALTPIIGFADSVSYSESKIEKSERLKSLVEIRDESIKAAAQLEGEAKTQAITKAQADFWLQADPILNPTMTPQEASSLVQKALEAIKNIFQ